MLDAVPVRSCRKHKKEMLAVKNRREGKVFRWITIFLPYALPIHHTKN